MLIARVSAVLGQLLGCCLSCVLSERGVGERGQIRLAIVGFDVGRRSIDIERRGIGFIPVAGAIEVVFGFSPATTEHPHPPTRDRCQLRR